MAIDVAASATAALDSLAARIAGPQAGTFEFALLPDDGTERYTVAYDGTKGKIRIEGSTPSAMAVGLNRYLRDCCHSYVSWYAADSIALLSP